MTAFNPYCFMFTGRPPVDEEPAQVAPEVREAVENMGEENPFHSLFKMMRQRREMELAQTAELNRDYQYALGLLRMWTRNMDHMPLVGALDLAVLRLYEVTKNFLREKGDG